jgi:branched-chain amino acid transport system substrate-binding protein
MAAASFGRAFNSLTGAAQAANHPSVKSAAFALALLAIAPAAVGCGGRQRAGATPVESSSCTDVLYPGKGEPDAIIVSDLPRRGYGQATSVLMIDAIKLVLRQRKFRAGELSIGYQSCNDSVGNEPYDPGLCERNAKAYAIAKDVLGVIGPWNSACTAAQLPILSRKAAGPLAMVNPANTYTGLTLKSVDQRGTPGIYYPDGLRNYVRVVPPDNQEGRAVALLASQVGAKSVVSVSAPGAYGQGVSRPFIAEARRLGIRAADFPWVSETTFAPLARRVASRKPHLVYLAGLPSLNGRRLLEDLRAQLGSDVVIVGSSAWFTVPPAKLGPSGDKLVVASVGVPSEKLPPAGKAFLRAFGRPAFDARQGYGAPEAAQATEVLLDAIGRSDGSRASVVDEVFKSKVRNGILGSFTFDRNGDMDPVAVGFFRLEDGSVVVDRVVYVPSEGG